MNTGLIRPDISIIGENFMNAPNANRSKIFKIALDNLERDLDSLLESLLCITDEHYDNYSKVENWETETTNSFLYHNDPKNLSKTQIWVITTQIMAIMVPGTKLMAPNWLPVALNLYNIKN